VAQRAKDPKKVVPNPDFKTGGRSYTPKGFHVSTIQYDEPLEKKG